MCHADAAEEVLSIVRRVTFTGDVVTGAAAAGARGTTALGHEPWQHAVKGQPVVVTLVDQRDEVSHRKGGFVLEQFQFDVALVGFEQDAGKVVGLGFLRADFTLYGPKLLILGKTCHASLAHGR